MSGPAIRIEGRPHTLGKCIGKGGEGEVFAIEGRADSAIKIYRDDLRAKRESKVRAMVGAGLAGSTQLIAFPAAIATDGAGDFLGFIMRLVSGYRPLHELYSPKSRKLHFPKADYRFVVRAALNVSNAVVKVHQSGCVIGDFNHSGVLVAQDATVSLIDADSFQYVRGGEIFHCVVGVPDFTPPELHGVNLQTVQRTAAHDNFGLAVAIFHLLAMGRHPYAGRYSGGDITMGEAIAQNRFAFSQLRSSQTRTTPPPGSISLKDFPPQIASAFEYAFGVDPAKRPDAVQWAALLRQLEGALAHCSRTRTHYSPSAAGSCIWCRIASQSGVDMFPDLQGPASAPLHGAQFDIERIAAQLRGIKLPDAPTLYPRWQGEIKTASPAVRKARRLLLKSRGLGFATIVAALAGGYFALSAAIVWIALGIYGLAKVTSGGIDEGPFKAAFTQADNRVQSLEHAFVARIGLSELIVVRSDAESWIEEYRGLEDALNREIARLKSSREARQREAFLDRFQIRRASIPGIGPAKTATLASYGIETAADVKSHAVRAVPGFGDVMTATLVAWRYEKEAGFRYNPAPDPSDLQAENAVRAASAARRADLQKKIRGALSALQNAPQQLAIRSQTGDPALTQALGERAQAEFDLGMLQIAAPARAVQQAPPRRPTAVSPAPSSAIRHTAASSVSPTLGLASQPVTARAPVPMPKPASSPRCPVCSSPMKRRTARKGTRAGRKFWGCASYPACRGTRN